jgi:hypothetical protein
MAASTSQAVVKIFPTGIFFNERYYKISYSRLAIIHLQVIAKQLMTTNRNFTIKFISNDLSMTVLKELNKALFESCW